MITSRIFGGLGNQMFQYAAGRALSLRTNQPLRLDCRWFARIPANNTPRDYELSIFKNITYPRGDFLNFFKRSHYPRFHQLCKKYFDYEIKLFDHYFEETDNFFETFRFPEKRNYNLNGYWQSEKYFDDFKDEIRRDFTFPAFEERENIEIQQMAKKYTAVSLHVRRGDYISKDGTQTILEGICSEAYYQNAIKIMTDQVGTFVFVVFSDDIDWVKEKIPLPADTVFVDWNTGNNSFRDMQLMSLCSHHIIANSSFSWWGAWLGGNENKIVIAPKMWLNVADSMNEYRCPDNWLRI
ncbi:MAG: alpha-1,2-fucosyltransferase [Lentisphaeria bacterium]|nr:alpha-1,2-fucosyltransferase [Lentisphaeria bacterium]